MTCFAIDGDTIACGQAHIRILGVNSPELHGPCRPAALAAQRFTAEVLRQNPVIIENLGRDRYGRILAAVYVGSVSPRNLLARWIIDSGHGEPYGSPDRVTPGRLLPPRQDRC